MGDTRKIEKYILIKAEHPEMDDVEVCRQSGYSEKRLHATASELRRNSRVQARIAAIRGKKLAAAPTLDSYHTLLNSAAEAAMRGDPSAWVLLQCAQAHGKEVLGQEPKAEESRAVLVKFVESELPAEQVQTVNKFLGQFEAQAGLPPAWSGRLTTEPQIIQAQAPALAPPQVRPAPQVDVISLPISLERRRHLERVSMPVGGGLTVRQCHIHEVSYESEWSQSPSHEWGWSGCPRCAVVN